ncbi:hypothetical protein FOZ60_015601 [Perkinsus olseni]|uniref:Uncharacterized protein n=1 Tax=Perkinsus olseni TaxID=32597 RepID=A0A7J6N682_PEROL|nr:hypothetical protein FOZ60_015601 [Perkinsus olseni]
MPELVGWRAEGSMAEVLERVFERGSSPRAECVFELSVLMSSWNASSSADPVLERSVSSPRAERVLELSVLMSSWNASSSADPVLERSVNLS